MNYSIFSWSQRNRIFPLNVLKICGPIIFRRASVGYIELRFCMNWSFSKIDNIVWTKRWFPISIQIINRYLCTGLLQKVSLQTKLSKEISVLAGKINQIIDILAGETSIPRKEMSLLRGMFVFSCKKRNQSLCLLAYLVLAINDQLFSM